LRRRHTHQVGNGTRHQLNAYLAARRPSTVRTKPIPADIYLDVETTVTKYGSAYDACVSSQPCEPDYVEQ